MRVLVPADFVSAKQAIRVAAQVPGPVYLRMGRAAVPAIYDARERFELGKAKRLREGRDLTLIACGVAVSCALEAANLLEEHDIHAEVIDAFSIKPLDTKTIVASIAKTGLAMTCEEHSIIGGLGSAVAELLAEHPGLCRGPLARIGVKDRFGTSGEMEELFAEYGLDAQAIRDRAVTMV
jgi:transketolase